MTALIWAALAPFIVAAIVAACSLAADAIEHALDHSARAIVPDLSFGRLDREVSE